jgi:hypothetical protein
MRLQELFETTEEDRAIISLGAAIYAYIQKYADEEIEYDNADDEDMGLLRIGKIGQLFNTPIPGMDNINIQLQTDQGIVDRLEREKPEGSTDMPGAEGAGGLWYNHNHTMVLNSDYLNSGYMQSVIVHELRHAMDDVKSEYKANKSKGYETPRNKSYRNVTKDPHMGNLKYLAQPAEINARYLQVMHAMVPVIARAVKLAPEYQDKLISSSLQKGLERFNIAHLFPEKEQSKDYKRLIKRAMDFIQKELAHAKSQKV